MKEQCEVKRWLAVLLVVVTAVATFTVAPVAQPKPVQAQGDGEALTCVESWMTYDQVYNWVNEYLLIHVEHTAVDLLGVWRVGDVWVATYTYWTESGEVTATFEVPIEDSCGTEFEVMGEDSYTWQCTTNLTSQEWSYVIASGDPSYWTIYYDGVQWWLGPFLITQEYWDYLFVQGHFSVTLNGVTYTKSISCSAIWHPDAPSVEVVTTQYVNGLVHWVCGGYPVLDNGVVVISHPQARMIEGVPNNLYSAVTGVEFAPEECQAYDELGQMIHGWYSNHGGSQPLTSVYQ